MKIKTKTGERIGIKEFFHRWKVGIDNITPLQRLTNEIRGSYISEAGYVFSLGAVIWARETIGILSYGLMLIFLGIAITNGLKILALHTQKSFLKKQMDYFEETEGVKK